MQWHFLVLPTCDCIAKIANNFVWGATFENQIFNFGGIGGLIFSVIGKKELSNVGQKWMRAKWESIKNMCQKHIKNSYCSTYQCTP